jgi:DNA-binding FadR family transcriptional regulator
MNTAERIYVASACGGVAEIRLTEQLARRIEDDIMALGAAAGTSLGSLRELAERYGAGRSAMREAVGLLERRGLGRLRPGPCGGFILERPRPESIGAALAEHFRSLGISARQLHDAREALQLMAAQSPDDPVSPVLARCLEILEADAPTAVATVSGSGQPTALPARPRRAAEIADCLAAEIRRSRSAGTRLGSEWDLCERFGVSRLTLRQAIRLLQDSGLVECRRGRGNGLLVRDRRTAGCIRLLLAYLIGEKLDPMAAGTLLFQLNAHVPALAVSRASQAQRRELDGRLAVLERCEQFGRFELLDLVHCVARLADSPIIDLVSRCLAAYEARFRSSLAERLPAAAQAAYFHLVRRLLEKAPYGDAAALQWARSESARCMLQMSRQRPI